MIKKILLALALLGFFPALASAQEQRTGLFMYAYDLDSTTYTYCRLNGKNGTALDTSPIPVAAFIKTTGSSTSVTENTASTNPFTDLVVGDVIVVSKPDGTSVYRSIVTRTDAANVVVDVALDLTGGFVFGYLHHVCGTTAAAGWINVSNFPDKSFVFYLTQVNATGGIDVRIECRDDVIGQIPVIMYPGEADGCGGGTLGTNTCNFTTAGVTSGLKVVAFEPWGSCRIGVKINTADDGGDTGANMEWITGYMLGTSRR